MDTDQAKHAPTKNKTIVEPKRLFSAQKLNETESLYTPEKQTEAEKKLSDIEEEADESEDSEDFVILESGRRVPYSAMRK